jgi:hypothetical protein
MQFVSGPAITSGGVRAFGAHSRGLRAITRRYAARQILVNFMFDVTMRALRNRNALREKAPGLKGFALIVSESDSLRRECFGWKDSK